MRIFLWITGIKHDGTKEILGFWTDVLQDLIQRGATKILSIITDDFNGLNDVIKKLYTEQKWHEIFTLCQNMLESDPKDLVALQNIATALLQVGKYDDVISYCDTVLQMNPLDEYAIKNKIFALERLKKYDQVILYCDKLLGKNQNDPWTHDSKGLALNELNRHEDAISSYDASLRIDPNNTTALMNKAITLSYLQRHADAIPIYDKVQFIDGTIKEACIAKSDAYTKLGNTDEAFLAAQGMLVSDIIKFKEKAAEKKMRVFDYYCLNEFLEIEKREKPHMEKLGSK